jgi:hypothetical protein
MTSSRNDVPEATPTALQSIILAGIGRSSKRHYRAQVNVFECAGVD